MAIARDSMRDFEAVVRVMNSNRTDWVMSRHELEVQLSIVSKHFGVTLYNDDKESLWKYYRMISEI